MYTRLGKKYSTLNEMKNNNNNIFTDNHKYLSTSECEKLNDLVKTYIESPFKVPIKVPEQTKLEQSPLSKNTR